MFGTVSLGGGIVRGDAMPISRRLETLLIPVVEFLDVENFKTFARRYS
jgi:hypothetical protein